ncbi:hypothetical protein CYLTODRAFT_490155 [Cylindrobasidium torrendii FP15055 ss-10]|uniref:F-box domain-containing protein n=1 Tax=Cylindrobasidium torrendii FP15055 ss-10 TaxID=1314674 RepID=A0A0D7BCU5_9AGAR|nr:hypothetical protein CYLTODRAFT_490155 [Cylindrobasidium torrendii FP15055 ss-10]
MASSMHLTPLEEPRSTTFQNFLDGEDPAATDLSNIQTFVADLRKTCNSLDNRAAFLRAELEETEKARASVRAVIDEHVALCRPITRLPAEILALIFGFTSSGKLYFSPQAETFPYDTRDPHSWRILTLAAVCRQWKDVLDEATALWTNLDLVQAGVETKYMRKWENDDENNGFLNALRSALSRSKHAPLDIAIRASWSNGLKVLQEHTHHIQRLSIPYYDANVPVPLEGLSMLRELDIAFVHCPPEPFQFSRPPQLQTLIIQCGWVNIAFGPWKTSTPSLRLDNLTRLELVKCTNISDGTSVGPDGAPWHTQCPALVYLKDQNTYRDAKAPTVPTTLEHLEYLQCASVYCFEALTCPALKTLYIPSNLAIELESHEDTIRQFVRRSGCSINRVELELRYSRTLVSALSDVLSNATELRLLLQFYSDGHVELLKALNERDETIDEWKTAPRLRSVSLVFGHRYTTGLLSAMFPNHAGVASFIQHRRKYDPSFNVDVEYWLTRPMQGAEKNLRSTAHYQMFSSAGADVQVKPSPKVNDEGYLESLIDDIIEDTDSDEWGDHGDDGSDVGEDSDEDEGH